MLVLRNLIFRICLLIYISLALVGMIWILLIPKKYSLMVGEAFLKGVSFLETTILGLRYRIEGTENLPTDGSYLVAMKHYSAYETLKLHLIFKDPAIIFKKELLFIPFWGWYAAKAKMVAVDRQAKGSAIKSIIDGANRVIPEGRPIVIFPQGTRVKLTDTPADKPYKQGIIRLYEATNLPLVPVAINSGVFWPKKGLKKGPGTITFKILPAIPPGKNGDEVMKIIKDQIETKSNILVEDAQKQLQAK